jgi:hypothetical protein
MSQRLCKDSGIWQRTVIGSDAGTKATFAAYGPNAGGLLNRQGGPRHRLRYDVRNPTRSDEGGDVIGKKKDKFLVASKTRQRC